VPDWLDDLALESVAPPPVWLPNRAARLADAGVVLARRFGRAGGASSRPSHYVRDTAPGLYGFGGRSITGAEVEADLEAVLTTINPPIAQGWIVASGAAAWFLAVRQLPELMATPAASIVPAIVRTGAPIILWLLAVAFVAGRQVTIELTDEGVRTRTWLERWLGGPGRRLGDPSGIRARLTSRLHLELATPVGLDEVSLALWPHTARQDLADDLPLWGVDCAFGHHRHRPERRRHRHHLHAAPAGSAPSAEAGVRPSDAGA
jgi:hypothetical protein